VCSSSSVTVTAEVTALAVEAACSARKSCELLPAYIHLQEGSKRFSADTAFVHSERAQNGGVLSRGGERSIHVCV
jgi:hypothetical protein